METLMEEEEEEYNWREVVLPSLILVVPETGERRRGRHIMIVVDHGPKSLNNKIVYDMTQGLMEKLAAEAFEVAMVKTKARIVEGDAGKVICKEAERLKPAAVVMGTGGQSLIQSVIQGSVSEYCFHNCKTAPIIVVPGKDAGEKFVL
ncbi:uncharacterized protein LOC121750277 [Salvia splendens]|uniref:uncharacterized protein LOC121750277 n=1 Tax=Salvia splendens TaxID=180675 RepID=UPI001C27F482|nr:uncharacterized protein LOC121750277 [Salvia splendens]